MIIDDTNPPAQKGAKRLRFDRYVLDLDRGCLLLDGNEIALRPKTFAVLRYLIENSGRLVSKDELFAAVWPNLAVTDDVQSIEKRAPQRFGEMSTCSRSSNKYSECVWGGAPSTLIPTNKTIGRSVTTIPISFSKSEVVVRRDGYCIDLGTRLRV
jgi:Transcriptional regulatory protein, C terminal